ncbi:hypothetical protein ENBRE01_0055 [Enteropsectra breve]|nr:hypothetical protein ENBRE01_0055 [Enteropsectra breve]
MRGFFHKVSTSNSHIISKSDKKKYNCIVNNLLDVKSDYKIHYVSNKSKVIRRDGEAVCFLWEHKIFPSIKHFSKDMWKCVYLDDGALEPLKRGADVMAAGILKNIGMCSAFEAGDVVGVEIIGQGLLAVGIAILGSADIVGGKTGPAVNILHIKDDDLYNESF